MAKYEITKTTSGNWGVSSYGTLLALGLKTKTEAKLKLAELVRPELLQAVKQHAQKNYEKGWDLLVETYSDDDILMLIQYCSTPAGAVAAVSREISPLISCRKDIQGTAF